MMPAVLEDFSGRRNPWEKRGSRYKEGGEEKKRRDEVEGVVSQ